MQSTALTVDAYIKALPEERQLPISLLRQSIKANLPAGFEEQMSYGMIGYVVPHRLYPEGYHCDPSLPVPFMNIASQKNFIAVYHMAIYADDKLMNWFVNEYNNTSSRKLDIGKSCIRFKKIDEIPHPLIGEIAGKLTVTDWISRYETQIKNKGR